MTAQPALYLGIDTGGTYTDAVLWSEAGGERGTVLAKAKALTTRHDLAVGISGAVDAVLAEAGVRARRDQAGLDVDDARHQRAGRGPGRPRRAGDDRLFAEADLERDGLKSRARQRPGGLLRPAATTCTAMPQPLDLAALEAALPELAASVSGFAVCAYFATRNPAHETRRARADPRADRPAGHRQPRAVGQARRPAPRADDAAQRAADLDDRPAGRGDRRLSRSARHRRAADGGARRRRAGLGRLRRASGRSRRSCPARPPASSARAT